MIKVLSKILKKTISEKKLKCIYVFLNRLFVVFYKRQIINKQYKIKEYSLPKKDVFFGCYDLLSISSDNNKLLTHVVSDINLRQECEIGYFDIESKEYHKITTTSAWNTQQGARLQWFSKNEISFNDFRDGHYCCRMINIETNEEKIISYPLYDINFNRSYGIYTDFDALNYYRPGYGYWNNSFNPITEKNGIWLVNLKDNKNQLLLSLESLISYEFYEECTSNHYLNNLKFSNDGSLIMFFHLWNSKDGKLRNRIIVLDLTGNIVSVMNDFDMASHYCWKNNNELFVTVMIGDKVEYRLYNITNNNYLKESIPLVDGHPSFITNRDYITDTNPDKYGMQHVFICKFGVKRNEILSVYHPPKIINEFKCDLHPRYKDNILNIDACTNKKRSQILVIRDNKLNYKENSADIYQNITGSFPINRFRIIRKRIMNLAFRDMLHLNKYLNTRCRFTRIAQFKYFTRNNMSSIGNNIQIGKNFHIMHFSNIYIGNEVKIGDNCILYQEVTIGKGNGGYPTIGNNVVIFAGAKIFGNIRVGNNVIIGANAVVNKDIPDNSVVVGVPGKVIKKY